MTREDTYEAIVIGTSAGGLYALAALLGDLPADYPLPLVVVQHRAKDQKDLLEDVLQSKAKIRVRQADEKEAIAGGCVYVAPPDYHLLVEQDRSFSLSVEAQVRYSRPAIDVLFESAAEVYRQRLVGIILTGANDDGTEGMRAVRKYGGLTIAQDPGEAEYPFMPKAAITAGVIRHVWTMAEIKNFLREIAKNECKR